MMIMISTEDSRLDLLESLLLLIFRIFIIWCKESLPKTIMAPEDLGARRQSFSDASVEAFDWIWIRMRHETNGVRH